MYTHCQNRVFYNANIQSEKSVMAVPSLFQTVPMGKLIIPRKKCLLKKPTGSRQIKKFSPPPPSSRFALSEDLFSYTEEPAFGP